MDAAYAPVMTKKEIPFSKTSPARPAMSPTGAARRRAEVSRRCFLKGTSAAIGVSTLFPIIVPSSVLGGAGETAPSQKLNIAGVGVGGMGKSNLSQMETENIVAICDVDQDYAAEVFKRYPKVAVYTDYRQMLEREKGLDAVMIATPDHTHAVISLAAMQSGKHVYCQKPLTHDVYEARVLAREAAKARVVTQMGIQGHSGVGARLICEWIWNGAIGPVREVDAWCSLSYFPYGHTWWSTSLARKPEAGQPVPPKLDWDLWLGPAPERPYHRCYHPATWRAWWDFGSGMMGDRGVHTLDPVFWALKLGLPTSVEATSTGLNPDTHPVASIVTFRFPARADLPPVKVTWYDGLRPPRPEELEPGRQMGHPEGGVIFKGDKGKLMCGVYGDSPRLIPESAMKAYERPAESIPRVQGSHEQDWIRCCKTGQQPGAHFGYSGPLTEIGALGNIARRMDAKIEWNAEKMEVSNLPEANQYVRAEYRKGWGLA
jgi:predicted dehydrogenase